MHGVERLNICYYQYGGTDDWLYMRILPGMWICFSVYMCCEAIRDYGDEFLLILWAVKY